MVNFAAKNNITDPEDLKKFDSDGYYFDEALSTDTEWVFKRDEQA